MSTVTKKVANKGGLKGTRTGSSQEIRKAIVVVKRMASPKADIRLFLIS